MNAYHSEHGLGNVIQDNGDEIIVEFESGIKRCLRSNLELKDTPADKIKNNEFDDFDKCTARTEAVLINSINDSWGVFSISRIELLPHQLWVCNQVLKKWPIRYLIADDVGLGKTIEAGLILWPLIASSKVSRLLILTPANLVGQWAERLYSLFNIKCPEYNVKSDTDEKNYWEINNMVIASYSTLQLDNKNRHHRFYSAPPWDLVIVDEAHHLNADERSGKTLVYQLIENMEKNNLLKSLLFFTGTPHRGKNYGFFSLMHLLDNNIFDPKKDIEGQYTYLNQFLIRNNKQNATDMQGNLLFKPIKQSPVIFQYSEEETNFYNQLTDFISSGKAYASTLSGKMNNQVVLVLIALQKIASSSVAAIRSALITRRNKFEKEQKEIKEKYQNIFSENIDEIDEDDDAIEQYTKMMNEISPIKLMQNEVEHLEKLIELSNKVKIESRIKKIIEIINENYQGEQVLLFTEYKRTQAIMINALQNEYGDKSTGFINGDNYLFIKMDQENQPVEMRENRINSANKFNKGEIRFLVSTEAAGEGIDLQEKCHVIIHIDLPWNPMRLHQRVGRLNRLGQKNAVNVISLRNPDTVESRIWEKLESKIYSISKTFNIVMEEPENLFEMILGMENQNYYNKLFFNATDIKDDNKFSEWFNVETQTLGGKETISVIEKMVGNASKFNLTGLSNVPKLDLPDLIPFFKRSIKMSKRRLSINEHEQFSFITPDEWKTGYGISNEYKNIVFRRKNENGELEETKSICGVGHKIFQKALEQAIRYKDNVCLINGQYSYFIYRIYDKITDYQNIIKNHYLVAKLDKENRIELLKGIDLFPQISEINENRNNIVNNIIIENLIKNVEEKVINELEKYLSEFKRPGYELFSIFWDNRNTIPVLK